MGSGVSTSLTDDVNAIVSFGEVKAYLGPVVFDAVASTVETIYSEGSVTKKKLLKVLSEQAFVLDAVAVELQSKNECVKTGNTLEIALELRRLILGDHPETAVSCNNLALLRAQEKRYGVAEKLYSEALAIQKLLGSAGRHTRYQTGALCKW